MTYRSEKKHFLKRVQFYRKYYRFQEPFKILVDGTFLFQGLSRKLALKQLFQDYFQNFRFKMVVTNCVREELKALGHSYRGAALLAKRLESVRCGHNGAEKRGVDACKCVQSLVKENQANHYFVATCDKELIRFCRNQPGVPVIYISSRDTLFLEKPSTDSRNFVESQKNQDAPLSKVERKLVESAEKNTVPSMLFANK
eukprot:jgi/Galph1/101/GphlegSOOS_G4766.1